MLSYLFIFATFALQVAELGGTQKKCYRVLEELCAARSEPCRIFVVQQLADLQARLVTALSSARPASKAVSIIVLCRVLCIAQDFSLFYFENHVLYLICIINNTQLPELRLYSQIGSYLKFTL
jgi:hypothetical protein